MQTSLYNKCYNDFFTSAQLHKELEKAVKILRSVKNIFFIGNGGSNSICSHMMQDYAKIGGYRTSTFSDASLITCFSNDFGFEHAMLEWLKIYFSKGDLLIAVSSSGESKNILNAVKYAKKSRGKIITLSGFASRNELSLLGNVNFHLPVKNYGVVECFHQVILHILLDSLNED